MKTSKNTPIFKKKLREGVLAEANNDGTIYVDTSLKPGTKKYKKTIQHELQHMNDMESGRAAYTDNNVKWEGKNYPRKDGKILYKSKWYTEGDKNLPWERVAIQAEKKIK
jgi:hypothetical protein